MMKLPTYHCSLKSCFYQIHTIGSDFCTKLHPEWLKKTTIGLQFNGMSHDPVTLILTELYQ